MIPSWLRFIGEALPVSTVSAGARIAAGDSAITVGPQFALTSMPRRIRKVASGEIEWPSDEIVWEAAEIARTLGTAAGDRWDSRWCAGPLALFAAGRFQVFAHLMIAAPDSLIVRKAELLDAVVSACETTPPESADFSLARQALIENGASELEIAQLERKFRKLPSKTIRRDRIAWTLDANEEIAFDRAWQTRSRTSDHSAIIAARLAQENPSIGLLPQRDIVLTMLRAAMSAQKSEPTHKERPSTTTGVHSGG